MVLVLTPVSERSAGKASGEASTPAFWLSCTTKGHESTSTQMGFFFLSETEQENAMPRYC